MGVIRLTESDIHNLVKATVRRLVESADEAKGVSMADKEDVIEEIVQCIKDWWENERETYCVGVNDFQAEIHGEPIVGKYKNYMFFPPRELTAKLGIAEDHTFNVQVAEYLIDKKYEQYVQKSVNGRTTYSPDDIKLVKPQMVFKKGYLVLMICAVNGKIYYPYIYSTIYHELNHQYTNLNIGRKGHEGMGVNIMTRRGTGGDNAHNTVSFHLDDSNPQSRFLQTFMYGDENLGIMKRINYIFYSLWETTERNAYTEELYGELQGNRVTRGQFDKWFPTSESGERYKQQENVILELEAVPENVPVWRYVGNVVHEWTPGRAKKRFINRSKELLNTQMKNMMRVAKYYFDRHEGQQKAPGM